MHRLHPFFAKRRRTALALGLGLLLSSFPLVPSAQPTDSEAEAWQALKDGAIVVFRHATAPGVGDPAGFKLDDCSTQRNLDADGQAQALAIGKAFAERGVAVGGVWSSAWCRAKETAELAFPKQLQLEPAFNSFFGDSSLEPVQTGTARELLLNWKGPGALVVVTHQINISALAGVPTRPGEGVVLRPEAGRLEIVGPIQPAPAGPR